MSDAPGWQDIYSGNEAAMTDAGASLRKAQREGIMVINAALKLEEWLSANTGVTSDWPVHLHVDNDKDAESLTGLLTFLTTACNAYRKSNHMPNT